MLPLTARGSATDFWQVGYPHTRLSRRRSPPSRCDFGGGGGGGNIIGFGLWLPFAWQSSDDAGAKAAFEHLHPCGCLGTAGVLVQIWAVLASAGWWQQSCLPLPLPFGGWPSLPLPKVVPGGAAPCRGVRANSATQEPPQLSHYSGGLDPAPASGVFCLCPQSHGVHRIDESRSGGGGGGGVPICLHSCPFVQKTFF